MRADAAQQEFIAGKIEQGNDEQDGMGLETGAYAFDKTRKTSERQGKCRRRALLHFHAHI